MLSIHHTNFYVDTLNLNLYCTAVMLSRVTTMAEQNPVPSVMVGTAISQLSQTPPNMPCMAVPDD